MDRIPTGMIYELANFNETHFPFLVLPIDTAETKRYAILFLFPSFSELRSPPVRSSATFQQVTFHFGRSQAIKVWLYTGDLKLPLVLVIVDVPGDEFANQIWGGC